MKPFAVIIVLAMVLAGCNDLNDLRPVDPGKEIPEAAVKVVKAKFPNAEELVFKPILEDKIWEVKLKSDADRYTSLVDYGKMWETFRVMPGNIPTALTESLPKTAFGDGTLSSYSTAYYATTAGNKLIYNYRGENYSFEWAGVYPNANSSATFDQVLYRITTYEIADLPASVKDTIQAMPEAGFMMGSTWVRLDDKKHYYVFARQKMGSQLETVAMLFDDKGKLRWSSTFFSTSGMINANSNMEQVPAGIKQYLDSAPELAGYEIEKKLINNVNGLTSYYITVTVGGVSRCAFFFDKDYNMLHKTYSVLLYK
ncbi:MAG: hypothetical protein BGO21_18610 [Dyadobacter sp. 50-39]|uniref:hypothetical protein n=1 Tax=Dyadobacter sp. 50-39 TaxID=1895756 RepID=UPI00096354AE|nr:hypothetical protein [Dyadobacter sp. 50-39]OJV14711.1 MAG: hypothetical protein BGO21_18610 [Dyadobacter sp. 50-39]